MSQPNIAIQGVPTAPDRHLDRVDGIGFDGPHA
jgi:hypothetical protein